jgi:hypothetical protein
MTPHIAKRRDYPPFVTSVESSSPDGSANYRDMLTIRRARLPAEEWRRTCVFIGANPSAAGKAGSDMTINAVLRTTCAPLGPLGLDAPRHPWEGCNELIVINLSPLRATHAAECIAALNDPFMMDTSVFANENAVQALKEVLEGVLHPVIWVGWGDCLKRHASALSRPFKELLEGREVLHLPLLKNGEPGHPCRAELKTLRRSVLWPKPPASCTLCGDELPNAAHPAQHLECLVLADRIGIPHDDRAGWEAALVGSSEADIRRALDGYRILPTLERRQRILTPYTEADIPF